MILSRSEMWYDNEAANAGRRLDFTVPGWQDLWYHLHWFAWYSSDNSGDVTPDSDAGTPQYGWIKWLTTDDPAAEGDSFSWEEGTSAGGYPVVCIDMVTCANNVAIKPGTFLVENRPLPDPAMTNGAPELRIRKWNKVVFGNAFGTAKVSVYINNARQIPLPGPMVQEFPDVDNSWKPWPGKPDGSYKSPLSQGPTISGVTPFVSSTTVTITTEVTGGTIHYTTDGTTPTEASPAYSTPLTVSGSGTTTVKAIVVVEGKSSAVASKAFTKS